MYGLLHQVQDTSIQLSFPPDFRSHVSADIHWGIDLVDSAQWLAWPFAKFSGATVQAFLPCAMFTNVGPIGIPLIALAYGPEGMAPAVVLLVISNILHFTLGAGVMSGKVDWRMVYANPLVWSTVLGIAS